MNSERRSSALLLLIALGVAASIASAADQIAWHHSFESALQSAQTSHKPLMVFAYRMDAPACEQMDETTLGRADVVAAAGQFECVALDVADKANEDIERRLGLGPARSANGSDTYSAYPITVFYDSAGKEQFRRHGFLPPAAFAMQLNKAYRLIECLGAVAEQPYDARRHRELGRAYMELDIEKGDKYYEAAIAHLRRAIQLDPENTTGANFDARVDLIIFKLPTSPSEAFDKLAAAQREAPDGERRFEIRYYMAVAQWVMGQERLAAAQAAAGGETLSDAAAAKILAPFSAKAAELLMPFHTAEKGTPYYESEWAAPALILLYAIRPDLNPAHN